MKRYNTPQQIMDEIDKFRKKAEQLTIEAEAQEAKHGTLIKLGDPTMIETAVFAKEQAKKLRRSSARIIEKKLPKLKAKLSEIMTPQLPPLDNGDPSIQA